MPITAQPVVVEIASRHSDVYLAGVLYTGQGSRVFAGSDRTLLIRSEGAGDEQCLTGQDAAGCNLAGEAAVVIVPRGEPFDLVDIIPFATAAERDAWIRDMRDAEARYRNEARATALQERSPF